MKKVSIFASVVFVLAFLISAQAQKVKVDVDATANFSGIKTYGWAEGQMARNPIIAEMIKTSIEKELAARGLTFSATPDINVCVIAAVGMDIQGVGPTWNNERYRYWGGYGNPAALMNVQSGTLLIDLIETKRNMSIWRGVAKSTLDGNASGDLAKDAKTVEGTVKKSVSKMFEKYPSGKK
jgi:Domain of unknown function (DUF4136)